MPSSEPPRQDAKLLQLGFSGVLFLVAALIGIFDSLLVPLIIGGFGVLLTAASVWVVAHGRHPWWTRSLSDRPRDPAQAPAAGWFKRHAGR